MFEEVFFVKLVYLPVVQDPPLLAEVVHGAFGVFPALQDGGVGVGGGGGGREEEEEQGEDRGEDRHYCRELRNLLQKGFLFAYSRERTLE